MSEHTVRAAIEALATECERRADEMRRLYEQELQMPGARDPLSHISRNAHEFRWHETAHRQHAEALRAALSTPPPPAAQEGEVPADVRNALNSTVYAWIDFGTEDNEDAEKEAERVAEEKERALLAAISRALHSARSEARREARSEIDPLVTVCDRCLQASCWQGIFMCQDSQGAGTVDLPRSALVALARESPDYWKPSRALSAPPSPDDETRECCLREREACAQRVEARLAGLRAIGLPLGRGIAEVLTEAANSVRAGRLTTSLAAPPAEKPGEASPVVKGSWLEKALTESPRELAALPEFLRGAPSPSAPRCGTAMRVCARCGREVEYAVAAFVGADAICPACATGGGKGGRDA